MFLNKQYLFLLFLIAFLFIIFLNGCEMDDETEIYIVLNDVYEKTGSFEFKLYTILDNNLFPDNFIAFCDGTISDDTDSFEGRLKNKEGNYWKGTKHEGYYVFIFFDDNSEYAYMKNKYNKKTWKDLEIIDKNTLFEKLPKRNMYSRNSKTIRYHFYFDSDFLNTANIGS